MIYSITAEMLNSSEDVFPCLLQKKQVYVKKARAPKNTLGVFIQKILFKLTHNPLVLPAYHPDENPVRFEVKRLRTLKEHGIRVPQILHVENRYFVMSDVGKTLERVLDKETDEQRSELIKKAMSELSRLHNMGFAHGGAQIKNMTVLDNEVYFLDFEVCIPPSQLEYFKLRDLLLFLFSLEKQGFDLDLRTLAICYEQSESLQTFQQLKRLFSQLEFVLFMESRLLSRFRMSDIRSFCSLIKKFRMLNG